MKYYIALDGATSNTRLRLIAHGAVISVEKLSIGAGSAGGKIYLTCDHERAGAREILLSAFAEEDLMRGG